jgi:type I restriction enzyme, S subunit
MIPEGWQKKFLRECIIGKAEYGANSPSIAYSNDLPRFVRITDITDSGKLRDTDKRSINIPNSKDYSLRDGDFLFARSGATVGKTYRYVSNGELQVFAGYLIRFRINQKILLAEYLEYFTQTNIYWSWVKKHLRSGAQPNINAEEFGEIPFFAPKTDEQSLICNKLRLWTRVIDLFEVLIKTKQKRRSYIIQQLILEEKKFTGYKKNWRIKHLGEIIELVQRPFPRPSETYKALGIRSHCKGTFERIVVDPSTVDMDQLFVV